MAGKEPELVCEVEQYQLDLLQSAPCFPLKHPTPPVLITLIRLTSRLKPITQLLSFPVFFPGLISGLRPCLSVTLSPRLPWYPDLPCFWSLPACLDSLFERSSLVQHLVCAHHQFIESLASVLYSDPIPSERRRRRRCERCLKQQTEE